MFVVALDNNYPQVGKFAAFGMAYPQIFGPYFHWTTMVARPIIPDPLKIHDTGSPVYVTP